jgi:hypothetical protein
MTHVSTSRVVKDLMAGIPPAMCQMADMHFSYRVQTKLEISDSMYDTYSQLVSLISHSEVDERTGDEC